MNLRPLADRVIVKRVEQETKTASGIVIPDNAAEKPDQGEVLSVGPGKRNERGDIFRGRYAGHRVVVLHYRAHLLRVRRRLSEALNQRRPHDGRCDRIDPDVLFGVLDRG